MPKSSANGCRFRLLIRRKTRNGDRDRIEPDTLKLGETWCEVRRRSQFPLRELTWGTLRAGFPEQAATGRHALDVVSLHPGRDLGQRRGGADGMTKLLPVVFERLLPRVGANVEPLQNGLQNGGNRLRLARPPGLHGPPNDFDFKTRVIGRSGPRLGYLRFFRTDSSSPLVNSPTTTSASPSMRK
jgi:hypothetical protein